MSLQFTILGSGSAGNSAFLECGETRLLIDAGLSARQIRQRLAQIGRAPEGLTGILITHEHMDHIQGLATLCSKISVPLYCNRLTKEGIELYHERHFDCRIFTTGATFEIGDLAVDSFTVAHDAYDPVGFVIHGQGLRLGFLTDLGHATKLVIERVRKSNILVLETNHDIKMLQDDTRRPWSLKQRILSRHGHLSNEAAAAAAEQIVSEDLKHLYLGHLSRDCNRPDLALEVVGEKLARVGAKHVQVTCATQDTPCPTLHFPAVDSNVPSVG